MKRLLLVVIAMGIIAVVSNTSFASNSTITVTCDFAGGQDCSVGESIFFPAGTYEFQVMSGAWGTWNIGSTGLSQRGWLWSLYIEQPGNPVPFMLGDDSFNGESDLNDGVFFPGDPGIPDENAAASAALTNALATNPSATITVSGSGETLRFYMDDTASRDNTGSVTIAVVPEPVSSSLFLIGGAVFAGRRYLKKRKV